MEMTVLWAGHASPRHHWSCPIEGLPGARKWLFLCTLLGILLNKRNHKLKKIKLHKVNYKVDYISLAGRPFVAVCLGSHVWWLFQHNNHPLSLSKVSQFRWWIIWLPCSSVTYFTEVANYMDSQIPSICKVYFSR